jgi:DinB family protein
MHPVLVGSMQPAISLLEKTPKILETMLCDLSGELLHWKPALDRWSISEVLAHISDMEQVFAERSRRIVSEESPALPRYNQAESPTGDYSRGSAGEHLAHFVRARKASTAFLKGLPASAGERIGIHSELGQFTLVEMLNEWASHDLGHIRQIAEIYRAHAFHPHAGPYQKYSNPRP